MLEGGIDNAWAASGAWGVGVDPLRMTWFFVARM